jgi:hypothetical protein
MLKLRTAIRTYDICNVYCEEAVAITRECIDFDNHEINEMGPGVTSQEPADLTKTLQSPLNWEGPPGDGVTVNPMKLRM